ncbi:hypothetical protein ASD42_32655 [Nocardia sp. Root136]|nr:hypothetical protein ASD42_32655 [Nocardia sp. Root136]
MTAAPPISAKVQRTEENNMRTDRAHVFFWTELCIAAGVSGVGNATQAVLHTTALTAVAAAVAVIPYPDHTSGPERQLRRKLCWRPIGHFSSYRFVDLLRSQQTHRV